MNYYNYYFKSNNLNKFVTINIIRGVLIYLFV